MPEVEVSRCGGVDGAMRRLKRSLDSNQHPKQVRGARHVKPTTQRRMDKKAARKRAEKRQDKENIHRQSSQLAYKISIARQHKVRDKNIIKSTSDQEISEKS